MPRQLLRFVSERLCLSAPTIASLPTLYHRYKTQYDHPVCPRLRNLSERKLYLSRGVATPEGLATVVAYEISITAIREGRDELLRLVASIHTGRVSAVVALQRFGTAARGDPVFRAADHLGRLRRTLFLCDCFSNAEFRREMHTLLNRGESVHQLQRAIYTSKIAPERGRRRDEMIAISGALTLLTSLVIAWNTERMQTTLDRRPQGAGD